MVTATTKPRARTTFDWLTQALIELEPGERVYATGVPWKVYARLAEFRDQRGSGVRIAFDQGRIELMSPRFRHEKPTVRLTLIVNALAAQFCSELISTRSTTLRKEQAEKGLEPDDCFYISNARALVGVEDVDLSIHPPPDLAVEVDFTSSSVSKEAIYGGLGVPEIWRHDQGVVTIRVRGSDGNYTTSTTSLAFPMATSDQLTRLVRETVSMDDLAAARHCHAWAKSLVPSANP